MSDQNFNLNLCRVLAHTLVCESQLPGVASDFFQCKGDASQKQESTQVGAQTAGVALNNLKVSFGGGGGSSVPGRDMNASQRAASTRSGGSGGSFTVNTGTQIGDGNSFSYSNNVTNTTTDGGAIQGALSAISDALGQTNKLVTETLNPSVTTFQSFLRPGVLLPLALLAAGLLYLSNRKNK